MAKPLQQKPTESELEILHILWNRQLATVREVHDELSKTKEAGYTTTLKLMQIMFEKGLVSRDDSSKSHIYKPLLSKAVMQSTVVGKIMNNFFAGSASQLFMQALGNHTPSKDEIAAIRKMLDEYE